MRFVGNAVAQGSTPASREFADPKLQTVWKPYKMTTNHPSIN